MAVMSSAADAKSAQEIATTFCAGCHGQNGVPISADIPVIWGQRADYLFRQLSDFKSGARDSPMMQPNVADLSSADLRALAVLFRSQDVAEAGAAGGFGAGCGARLGRRRVGPLRAMPSGRISGATLPIPGSPGRTFCICRSRCRPSMMTFGRTIRPERPDEARLQTTTWRPLPAIWAGCSTRRMPHRRTVLLSAASFALASPAFAAELTPLRLGLLHTLSPAPIYIAKGRGYFGDQGTDLRFVFFDAAQPIAAAAVASDIDVGNFHRADRGLLQPGGKGALRVIGGGLHEQKGAQGSAILAPDRAYDAAVDLTGEAGRPQRGNHAGWFVVPLHHRAHGERARLRLKASSCGRCSRSPTWWRRSGAIRWTRLSPSRPWPPLASRAGAYHRLDGRHRAEPLHRGVHHPADHRGDAGLLRGFTKAMHGE